MYQSGVYSGNKILEFNIAQDSGSSSIVEDGAGGNMVEIVKTSQVPVVSLDSTVYDAEPNFIKMDIEGAEREALLGAKNILQSYKPALAISAYHKPQDIYELPLLIRKINPSYKMHYRVHSYWGGELVLYATGE